MFGFSKQFRTRKRVLWASVLTGVVATMMLALVTSAAAQSGREVFVQTVAELYDAVNGGSKNDVIVLSEGMFILDDNRGPLRLKPGMVLQGASEWEAFDPKGPPSSVQPGTETVIDGTNLILEFPNTLGDGAEGVIEITPGNRLANLTVRGDTTRPLSAGGAAVVLMRPATQGTRGGRVVIQDVVIDGGAQGFLALHRFDDDDKAHSVVEIDHSIVKNAGFNGIIALLWQGVSDSSFHITIERCRLKGSRFGIGVFTTGATSFFGEEDNNNDVLIFSSDNIYEENSEIGALFLPRLGANDNRFHFTSQSDVFAGNGEAVRAFGSGFATEQAPSNNNRVILHLLGAHFNSDIIRVGGTREPEPPIYPGIGNQVDLLVRQGESNLPSEADFLKKVNETDSNFVQLIGGHIQVEYVP